MSLEEEEENRARARQLDAERAIEHLEDFIKAVVTNMTSQDVADSLHLARERETMRALIAELKR